MPAELSSKNRFYSRLTLHFYSFHDEFCLQIPERNLNHAHGFFGGSWGGG